MNERPTRIWDHVSKNTTSAVRNSQGHRRLTSASRYMRAGEDDVMVVRWKTPASAKVLAERETPPPRRTAAGASVRIDELVDFGVVDVGLVHDDEAGAERRRY